MGQIAHRPIGVSFIIIKRRPLCYLFGRGAATVPEIEALMFIHLRI